VGSDQEKEVTRVLATTCLGKEAVAKTFFMTSFPESHYSSYYQIFINSFLNPSTDIHPADGNCNVRQNGNSSTINVGYS
jgi:hypothetical protein